LTSLAKTYPSNPFVNDPSLSPSPTLGIQFYFRISIAIAGFWLLPNLTFGAASLQDIGLQQVVEVKEKHWGAKAGYQFRIIGRTSPFFNDEPIPDKAKSAILINSAYLNGQFGNHWLGAGMMRYSAGVAVTRTNHLEDFIDWIDHDSQTAFLEASYFTSKNWVSRLGIRTSRLVTLEDDETQFSEFAPMFSIAKLYNFGSRQYLSIRWLSDYSFTDSLEVAGTDWTEDRLNHWSTGLQLQHSWIFAQNWTLESFGSLQYNNYSKGINKDRDDTAFSLGTSVDWEFLKFFNIGLYGEYLRRHSSIDTYSFNNWDGGLRFNAAIGF